MLATNFEINQDLMLDTLSFSKNMQQAGMEKNIADMLALNLKNLQINQLENLLTKNEFRIFEKEMRHFQVSMYEFRQEMIDFKKEIKEDFSLFKQETKSENSQFRQEMRADHDQFKQEMRADHDQFKQEMRAEIAEFKQEINEKIETLVTKKEFYSEMDKLALKLTIRLGAIMATSVGIFTATGIGIVGLFLKF
jgi:hypothetical protein